MTSLEPTVNGDICDGVDAPADPAPQCPCTTCTIPVDITLRSSDGLCFGAHKKNLESFSKGFPPDEWTFEETDEIVELPEKGIILRLLLRFMHNAALPRPSQECSKWDLDDLIDFIDTAEKYGVFIALQAGEEALLSRAGKMSQEDLLRVLLREASRSSSNIIDEFARHTLSIPTKDVIIFFKSYPQIYMTWALYRTEWAAWKKEYQNEMTATRVLCVSRYGPPSPCSQFVEYRRKLHVWLQKLGEFPTVDHFTQAVVLLDKLQGVKKNCLDCKSFEWWKPCVMKVFGRQKRWVDCILN